LLVLNAFDAFIRDAIQSIQSHWREDILYFLDHLQGVFERLDKQLCYFLTGEKLELMKKLRWAFGGKSGYGAILQELKQWEDEVAHVITAMKLRQDRDTDPALYKRLFATSIAVQRADEMDDLLHGRPGPTSAKSIELDVELFEENPDVDGDRGWAVYDNKQVFFECKQSETRLLASVLGCVDAASMHIFPCLGTLVQEQYPRALLLYTLPDIPDEKSNLALDILNDPKPPLEVRVQYAVEICQAVLYTHAAGLVHKSIRPDNVLMLGGSHKSAFLVGFDLSRLRDPRTYSAQTAEEDPIKRLYHHPQRQIAESGGRVVRFGIRHDMYSLGVLLIELGFWKPLGQISQALSELGQSFDAGRLHQELVDVATPRLAADVGSRYASAVLCCLQGSTDPDNDKPEKEAEVRELFYEAVLRRLMQIVI
jgi:hypothetical protein